MSDSEPRLHMLEMRLPVTVTDFNPYNSREVYPVVFVAARARQILETAQKKSQYGWESRLDKFMTEEERAYVIAVWNTIPSGSSNWMSAFYAIRDGFNPLPADSCPQVGDCITYVAGQVETGFIAERKMDEFCNSTYRVVSSPELIPSKEGDWVGVMYVLSINPPS